MRTARHTDFRAPGWVLLAWAVTAGVVACARAQAPLGEAAAAADPDAQLLSGKRVVHHFDFDERHLGNLEDIPMYWERLRAIDFPRFAVGSFDEAVGHDAPPSFRLKASGRSVAFQYLGPETRVRRNSEYRVVGYIRADQLEHGRACLSAHYVDRKRQPLPGTLTRTHYVSDADAPHGWVRVETRLGPAPAEASTIAVAAWVVQESVWRTRQPGLRYIQRNDVEASVWFDDISIFALPRLGLASSAPGNVLPPDEPADLIVTLADDEGSTLEGVLTVTSADGERVVEERLAVRTDDTQAPQRVPVGHLPPALYDAELAVREGDAVIAELDLTFARLGALPGDHDGVARPFGVVIDPARRTGAWEELALLREVAARSAKLPLWSGVAPNEAYMPSRQRLDRVLQELVRDNFALVGVLAGPPAEMLAQDGVYPRSLIELLTEDHSIWQDRLAVVVAPYAGLFRYWQVGADAAPEVIEDADLPKALQSLREAMRPFLTAPRLAAPAWTLEPPPEQKLPAEQLTLTIRPEIGPEGIATYLDAQRQLGYEHLSVYLMPLRVDQYRRLPRLARWAKRIIEARHSGAQTVYVPQPWTIRPGSDGPVAEPIEEYLVLRTLAAMLCDAEPAGTLRVAEGVEARVFVEGDEAVIALWDTQAGPEGRNHALQLGQATHQVDLWGRATRLTRSADGRQVVRLTTLPVVVRGVERWLVDFRQSIEITPAQLVYGQTPDDQQITLAARTDYPVSGTLRLVVPEDWEAEPSHFRFHLMGQRSRHEPLVLRSPPHEAAGLKPLLAQITLAGSGYCLEVPVPVTLGLADVEVHGVPFVEGPDLILRHTVTNRSQRTLSFRGSANVPGHERQYRPFINLAPGDTQTVEYRFTGGGRLAGESVRLVLREMADGPRMHNLELTIP